MQIFIKHVEWADLRGAEHLADASFTRYSLGQ